MNKKSKFMKLKPLFYLLLALTANSFLISCGKDEPKQMKTLMQTDNPSPLIERFMQQMEMYNNGVMLKSGQRMCVDSAVWYIDAALNYTYANAGHPFERLHRDTLYTEMNLENGYEAAYEEVFDTYAQFLQGISRHYYEEIEGDNKQFIMATVEDMGPLPQNKRKLRIITAIGSGILQLSDDFGQGEAYFYNRDAIYNCNWENASGAPIIFEAKLSNHFNPPPSALDCRWYFYGTTTTVILNYEDYQLNVTPVNYLDYKIYATSSAIGNGLTNEVKCLEWNQNNSGVHEMQFYYDHLKVFVNEWLNSSQNTGNKKFALSFIDSPSVTEIGETLIYHKPHLIFRKRSLECQTGPEPLPL